MLLNEAIAMLQIPIFTRYAINPGAAAKIANLSEHGASVRLFENVGTGYDEDGIFYIYRERFGA